MQRITKKEFLERKAKGLGAKRTKNNWWSIDTMIAPRDRKYK